MNPVYCPRVCATPGCSRDTFRPNDPISVYNYCPDCIRVLMTKGQPPKGIVR